MGTLRITEAELARNVRSALEKVEGGSEIIVERDDHRPLAIIKQPLPVGRKISESIAIAKAYEQKLDELPVPDENFARDVEEGIKSRHDPIRNIWDE